MVDGPFDASISKVGQVSIPRPVRDALNLGDRVHFIVPDFIEGVALLVPEATLQRWLQVGLDAALRDVLAPGGP